MAETKHKKGKKKSETQKAEAPKGGKGPYAPRAHEKQRAGKKTRVPRAEEKKAGAQTAGKAEKERQEKSLKEEEKKTPAEKEAGKTGKEKEGEQEKKTGTEKEEPEGKTGKAKAEQKAEAGKQEKKRRPKEKSRKALVKKTKEVIALRAAALGKTTLPVFRGRFGKRSIRRKSKEKWDKWRFPRGIDVKHVASDGFNPKGGYRTPKPVRGIHPGGYRESMVRTIREIESVPDMHAVRIASGIGRKKKMAIVDRAIEKGIKVLNP